MRGLRRTWIVVLALAGLAVMLVGGAVAATSAEHNGVTATFEREPDSNGFYTEPVEITFEGTLGDPCDPPSITYGGGPDDPDAIVSSTCTPVLGEPYTGEFEVKYDGQPPELTVPGSKTEEATKPGGADVTFNATATDFEDQNPNVSCTPPSGSTFAIGTIAVNCTATDHAGRTDGDSFNVTVEDTTGPMFGSAPDVTKEGNVAGGYQGSAYSKPAASDNVDGPLSPDDITCVPGPGAKFDLGTIEVTCKATDDAGNPSEKKFDVTVTDKTAPEFLVQPQEVFVQAKNADTGTPATNPCIQNFLNAPTAGDVVDGGRPVTNDAPDQFPVGDTEVTFTTSDTSGNTKTAKALVKIRKGPQGACTIDDKAPRNARRVTASERNKLVLLRWLNPTGADFFRVEIRRNTANAPTAGPIVYKGRRGAFRDRDVRNGVTYRYVVYAVDEAGNHRGGIQKLATPHRILLLRPRDEARVLKSRPPTLKWVEKKRARYYNVQLYRYVKGTPRKVLSRWPVNRKYTLTRKWQFEGRRHKLRPGRYVWYVWPGFGPRSAGEYGDVMGASGFRVVKER